MSEGPRIIGSEMEWPMTVRYDNSEQPQQLGDTASLRMRLPHGVVSVGSGSYMLSNGGRYYLDVGDRVEYATPETTSFDDLVVRELAGERIVMHSLLDYARSNEKVESVVLSKRVTDSFQSGWGYHVNLSADREKIPVVDDEHTHLLGLHMATSSPMLGAGAVYRDGDELKYSYSQKALSLTGDYINGTTGTSKPLINQRDEPLSTGIGQRRIHLTSFDPHISPWASKMTVGTSSLVLRAIEQGRGRELRLAKRVGYGTLTAINLQVALDLDMVSTVELADLGTTRAVDVQEEIYKIVEKTDHTDEEAEVLDEWRRAIDILQTRSSLLIESDAIAKLALIRAWTDRNDVEEFNHPQVLGIDDQMSRLMTYHKKTDANPSQTADVIHSRSRAAKLRNTIFKKQMPSEGGIADALTNPPTTTRALERGRAIATGKVTFADWSQYRLTDEEKVRKINNPYIPDSSNEIG